MTLLFFGQIGVYPIFNENVGIYGFAVFMSAKEFSRKSAKGVVLIVDDNPDDIELMQLAFKKAKAPCGLMSVPDGAEAIRYLAGEGDYADRKVFPMPLLILLDLNMPRVNGFEVLAWIQKNSASHSQFPLVLTLSYSHLESDIRRAYELGTSAYVAKPVDLDSSVSLVKLLINLERIAALRPRRTRAQE
jgi:CheY-like chemotaxis protein